MFSEQLASALAVQDQLAFAAVLPTAEVAVLVKPPAGSGIIEAQLDDRGRRVLMVFSGPEAARLWSPTATFGVVQGKELAGLVVADSIDLVCFDPAGPYPIEMGSRQLMELLSGVSHSAGAATLFGKLSVTENIELYRRMVENREAFDLRGDYIVVPATRVTPAGRVDTVFCNTHATAESIAKSISILAPPGAPVDVVAADESQMRTLVDRFSRTVLRNS